MTESAALAKMTDELEALLGEKRGLRKGDFPARVARAGRRLPKRVHRDARLIGEALTLSAHPKLARRIDLTGVQGAHRRIKAHLQQIEARRVRLNEALRLIVPAAQKAVRDGLASDLRHAELAVVGADVADLPTNRNPLPVEIQPPKARRTDLVVAQAQGDA